MDDGSRKTKVDLPSREDRRKAALKANMARRKAQARARAADTADAGSAVDLASDAAAASGEAEQNNKND